MILSRLFRWLTGGRAATRAIFSYHDGTRQRRADPLVIGRKLEESCPDYLDCLATLADEVVPIPPSPVADSLQSQHADAERKLLAAVRCAFDVQPLTDDAGLSEAETVLLLAGFLEFMGGLAKDARPFATLPSRASPSMPPASLSQSSADFGLPVIG